MHTRNVACKLSSGWLAGCLAGSLAGWLCTYDAFCCLGLCEFRAQRRDALSSLLIRRLQPLDRNLRLHHLHDNVMHARHSTAVATQSS